MRKGTTRFNVTESPIYFVPTIDDCPPEEFRDITSEMVPGVNPYYMISSYGRVWHKYLAKFLSVAMDTKGYLFIPLSSDHGQQICRIHRLVLSAFCPIPNWQMLNVNHKNGIRSDDHIWNLEWTTQSENMIHAFKTGLNGAHKRGNVSDEQVHEICKLLEDRNNTINAIADKVGVPYTIVLAIQGKRAHTDISDSYNIQSRKINSNLTYDEVKQLCEYFEQNRKRNGETLEQCSIRGLTRIGYSNPTSREIRTVKKLLTKETYTYISCEYNF